MFKVGKECVRPSPHCVVTNDIVQASIHRSIEKIVPTVFRLVWALDMFFGTKFLVVRA